MSEPNLFDVKPKAKRQQAPSAPPGAMHRLIGIYVAEFRRRYREDPVITAGDAATLKRMVLKAGQETVARRLPIFLGLEDAYLSEHGYPLRLLEREWNRLIAQDKTKPQRPSGQSAEETSEYLRRLKRG